MATIRIERTSEFNNLLRNYKIFINGNLVGSIANGETKDFSVPAGRHIVSAKVDWCSSPDISIDINYDQTINLKVGGFKNGRIIMPLGLILVVLHLSLSKAFGFQYMIFLLAPLFLLPVYYLTIGRKNYLTLDEINDD